MSPDTQSPKRRDNIVSSLNMAIDALNLVGNISGITPAKAVFGSVNVILIMIRVGFFLLFIEQF